MQCIKMKRVTAGPMNQVRDSLQTHIYIPILGECEVAQKMLTGRLVHVINTPCGGGWLPVNRWESMPENTWQRPIKGIPDEDLVYLLAHGAVLFNTKDHGSLPWLTN